VKVLAVMADAISEPRADVRDTAPKIVSLEIPIDKIGEVIGPKGKVINALQQETGTDIAVEDDGLVGTVTIGAKDGGAVAEARRRIEMILDPPKAEVGAVYTGKVVNITKFGAFVNILPGRDGLVHISKLGRGRRIDKVEDVVDLGDEIEVRVDDIDPQGKVSLSLAGDPNGGGPASSAATAGPAGDDAEVSFEDTWEAEAQATFGDLGPAQTAAGPSRGADSADRGPRRNPRRRRS
jgi:polyribonucleotide nucleotidyltransferase